MVTTGGEWNLIHSRNLVLREQYGIKIRMTVLLPADTADVEPVHFKTAPYPIEIILYNNSRRGIINAADDFYLKAVHSNYKAILTSGTGFTLFATKNLAKFQGKLIVDMHGDPAELYEYSPLNRYLWDYMRYFLFASKLRSLLRRSDGVLVVSDSLAENVRKVNPGARIFQVPCACRQILTYDEYRTSRAVWRGTLHIGDDDIVFVYSGALNEWQCIHEHLDIVAECCKRDERIRALFFTNEIVALNNLIDSRYGRYKERISILSVKSGDIVKALCAADMGLLVRKDGRTNHVAFPNKFDEYLAAGLKVVTTTALRDIARIVSENEGMGLLVDCNNIGGEIERVLSFARKDVPITADRFHHTQEVREGFSLNKRLKGFAEYLQAQD
jgi:hypothetical protein